MWLENPTILFDDCPIKTSVSRIFQPRLITIPGTHLVLENWGQHLDVHAQKNLSPDGLLGKWKPGFWLVVTTPQKKIVVIAIRPISIISTAIFFSNHQLSTSNCHGQGPRLSNGEPFGGFNPTEIVGYHDKKQTSLKPGIRI